MFSIGKTLDKETKVIIPLETPFITHPRACNCASGLCLTFHLCKVKARSSLNNKCQSSSVESVLLEYWNLGWQVWHSQADLYYLRTANNQDYPALLWLFDLKINYCKFSPSTQHQGHQHYIQFSGKRSGKWQSPDFLACNALSLSEEIL